jgi:ribose transport system substrate-binding protein
VRATPWESFKGAKKPWKIGLITFPVGSPWLADVIKQVGVEFNKAKAKGLVTGTLQKYIQPSYATATPEQQIAAIQQMVRNGVNGILLLPLAGPPLAPAIDAAGKAGVPVVILDNVIDQAKYVVNVWSQNNSPAAAGVAGLVKKGNVLFVRGIAGNPVESAFQDAAVADVKACPGLKIVGTIWGKWTNATAKAETLKWLAAHPDTKVDGVIQNGIMMAGIIQAFQQAGRPVPPISGGGCQGGELSWWLAHKSTYNSVATCFNGYQTGWSEFRLLLRILNGNGLKVRDIHVPVPIVTSKNVAVYATPGKPLSWPGEPRGPINGWAPNAFLDGYFLKPGNPGGF